MTDQMRRITLASRPQGTPTDENFKLETGPIPEPGDGEVLGPVDIHFDAMSATTRLQLAA